MPGAVFFSGIQEVQTVTQKSVKRYHAGDSFTSQRGDLVNISDEARALYEQAKTAGQISTTAEEKEPSASHPSWKDICETAGLPMGNDGTPLISLMEGLTGAKEENILPENWAKMQELAERIRSEYERTGTTNKELVDQLRLLRAFGDQKVLSDSDLAAGAAVLKDGLMDDFSSTMSAICSAMGLPDWFENSTVNTPEYQA